MGDKSKPSVLYIALAVVGAILANQLAQGAFQKFNIAALLLLIASISLIIWLFVYSPFGRWLNRWIMSSYDDFLKSIEDKPSEKGKANKE